MKVKLITTCMIVAGKRYSKGDTFDVSDNVYNQHIARFEKVATEKKPNKVVVTNDAPTKKKKKKFD
jgi:hypothetical protein